ncbi:hypothetical protein [Thermogemmatispora carboxidivorans]|uniref:hypothetical protein n=1 Tax=Thermogemmatispora carboxidivorans TaxID=1382306 RepID=UPI00069BAA58|nr:hypothetical protein [Thermogemmatispora carboxidivorans]
MQDLLSLTNLLITLALIAGAFAAYHYGFARTADEVKARVISVMQHEIDTLKDRLAALEKENLRLSQIIGAIRLALQQRGLHITIDGELVCIHDQSGGCSQTSRIIAQAAPAPAASTADSAATAAHHRHEEV